MNVPNLLTTLRLFLVPVFAYSLLHKHNIWFAVVTFLVSGFLDIIDGFIARRLGQITDFGKLYDPFVDKTMQIVSVWCLYLSDKLPRWVILIILVKEVTMMIAATVLYFKNTVVHALWYGKLATVVFYTTVLSIMVFRSIPNGIFLCLKLILVCSTFASLIGYIVKMTTNRAKAP